MNSLSFQKSAKRKPLLTIAKRHKAAVVWQRGLTLVELMIAVALAMILMLGALQIFLFSKNTYSNNQQLAEIQENGRFALYNLVHDIRNAGYLGQCLGDGGRVINHVLPSEDDIWSHNKGFFFGWSSASKPSFAPANSLQEGVFIQLAAGGGQDFQPHPVNQPNNDDIEWPQSDTFKTLLNEGDVGVISDGQGCDIFINDSSEKTKLTKNNAKNRSWSHGYDTDNFEQLRMVNVMYYIANDEEGEPTLYRVFYNYGEIPSIISGSAKVVAAGVSDLRFRYGVTNNPLSDNPTVDSYESVGVVSGWSAVDWERVIAVEVSFTINLAQAGGKKFSTVIGLRNRVL